MSKNTKLRYSISVVAVSYLLCLALESAQSTATPGQAPVKIVRPKSGEIRRAAADSGTGGINGGPVGSKRSDSELRAGDSGGNNKFQPRMMRAEQQQQSAQSHQHNSYFQDSWNPHSLIPTFTDQEQGDEMVALASDSEPEHLKLVPPPGNRSTAPSSHPAQKYDYRESKLAFEKSRDDAAHRDQGSRSGGGGTISKQRQQVDEYYGDDEDDDDEQPPMKPLRGEFGAEVNPGPSQQDNNRKESDSHSGKFKATMQQQPDSQYGDYPVSFDESYRRQVEPAVNRSVVKLSAPSSESGWLPSAAVAVGNGQMQNYAAEQQQHSRQQQQLQTLAKQQDISQPDAGEKLADLFGGRETMGAFRKADFAIEYLRNILKNKQSLMSNNNNSSSSSETSSSNLKAYDLIKEKRLSSFATRLNQILNNTAAFDAPPSSSPLNQTTAKKSLDQPIQIEHDAKKIILDVGQVQPQQQALDQLLAEKSFLTQQADAKFSIGDVKATTTLNQVYQTQAYASSTTKLPDDGHSLSPLVDSIYSKTQVQAQPAIQAEAVALGHESSLGNAPNGTPVGGDYIESLDDFPRGLRPAQLRQMQQQQMFAAESQLVPVRHQDSKHDQLSSSQTTQSGISESSVIMRDNSKQHQQPQQQQQPVQVDSMQLHPQATYEPHHTYLSGAPASSRYFQMHQQSPNFMIPPNQKFPITLDSSRSPKTVKIQPIVVPANFDSLPQQHPQQPQRVVDALQVYPQQQQIFANKTEQHQNVASRKERAEDINSSRPLKALATPKPKQPPAHPQLYHNQKQEHNQYIQHQQQQQRQQQPQQQQVSQQQTPISSKIYKNEQLFSSQPPVAHQPAQAPIVKVSSEPPQAPPAAVPPPKAKPPKIVSYNYFESPNESGESEITATNFQLGDALYSSNGGLEHTLSNAELEAIQNQFMTAEHPVVPVNGNGNSNGAGSNQPAYGQQQQDQQQANSAPFQSQESSSLAGLLASLKNMNNPEVLQRLNSPAKQAEEALKELASNQDDQIMSVVAAPPAFNQQPPRGSGHFERDQERHHQQQQQQQRANIVNQMDADEFKKPLNEPKPMLTPSPDVEGKTKKKSLIVYLNHPRPLDMSKVATPAEGYSLAQSIGDQSSIDSFISAKEFDSHGLSKDSKHLDIANLQGLGEIKDGQDKDGLSVVVIGDAYKYKKIVLLISSKSGGLKFIPMVKDMKKK